MKPIKMRTIIIITMLFLVVVQILFSIPAPQKWLVAVWKAGDLLTFVGTIALGFVAYKQTEQANQLSSNFIKLQAEEYTPTIIATDFLGITKFGIDVITEKIKTDVSVAVMRTAENELLLGYTVLITDDDIQQEKPINCRAYEIHLKYFSKTILSSISILSVSFILGDKKQCFDVNKSIDISLENGQEFTLFLYMASNEDFLSPNADAHFYVKAPKMEFIFEFQTVAGSKTQGTLAIQKFFTVKNDKNIDSDNTERFVSSSYKKMGVENR